MGAFLRGDALFTAGILLFCNQQVTGSNPVAGSGSQLPLSTILRADWPTSLVSSAACAES